MHLSNNIELKRISPERPDDFGERNNLVSLKVKQNMFQVNAWIDNQWQRFSQALQNLLKTHFTLQAY
jgi:hypothetical protein